MRETIEWTDFTKVDIRVGKICDVKDFPKARKPAYILTIDFGKWARRKLQLKLLIIHIMNY